MIRDHAGSARPDSKLCGKGVCSKLPSNMFISNRYLRPISLSLQCLSPVLQLLDGVTKIDIDMEFCFITLQNCENCDFFYKMFGHSLKLVFKVHTYNLVT